LDWITGLLIRVYLLYVFFVPVSARSAQPQLVGTECGENLALRYIRAVVEARGHSGKVGRKA
jgi:hypothetical protein